MSQATPLRITGVSTAVIEANYDWTIVKVDTEEGVSGLGEAFMSPGLPAMIADLTPLLVGRDAADVEPLVRILRLATAHAASGGGAAMHAISGIEAALWDASARSLGVPLNRLLGGRFRDRVRIYADCHAGDALESYSSILVSRRPAWAEHDADEGAEVHWDPAEREGVYTPEAYARRAREMAARGFTALKFDLDLPRQPHEDLYSRTIAPAQLDRQVELAKAACEAVAPDVQVAFDCHWRYAPKDALRLARALEPLGVLWLEDPVPPEDPAASARVAAATTTPIATGENTYLARGFEELIRAGALDIVAPDLQKVGGLAEGRRIADLADRHYLPMAPHNIAGPVGTMASAHLCAAIPNFLALEWHAAAVPFFDELVTGREQVIKDGYIDLSDAPGIGVDLDLEACQRYAKPGAPFFT